MTKTDTPHLAKLVCVPDISKLKPSMVESWVAVLCGLVVVNPRFFSSPNSPHVAYKPALQVKRWIWISDGDRASHAEVANVIVACADAYPARNWRFIDDRDAFVSRAKKHGTAHVMALITTREKRADPILNALKHAKDGPIFLKFVKKVDPLRSHFVAQE